MLSTSSPFCSKIFHCCAANKARLAIETLGYETLTFVLSCAKNCDPEVRNAIAQNATRSAVFRVSRTLISEASHPVYRPQVADDPPLAIRHSRSAISQSVMAFVCTGITGIGIDEHLINRQFSPDQSLRSEEHTSELQSRVD